MKTERYDSDETFIDLRGILERYKVPPDPDTNVSFDRGTWSKIEFDANHRGMRIKDLVRKIVRSFYEDTT